MTNGTHYHRRTVHVSRVANIIDEHITIIIIIIIIIIITVPRSDENFRFWFVGYNIIPLAAAVFNILIHAYCTRIYMRPKRGYKKKK
jgi:hypothetical protein